MQLYRSVLTSKKAQSNTFKQRGIMLALAKKISLLAWQDLIWEIFETHLNASRA